MEIVSTGSTARTIADAGLPVTPVEQVTGFPECLDGRVKTLHPGVHAGLLADLRLESHRDQLAELGIEPFDLLVSNLYPFSATVASGAGPEECVEQIDIGGPAMVRSAAKNHASVAVVTSPGQYPAAARGAGRRWVHPGRAAGPGRRGVRAHRDLRRGRGELDAAGGGRAGRAVPDLDRGHLPADRVLRYGENPHQPAALYRNEDAVRRAGGGRAAARQGDVLQQLRRRGRGPAGGVRLRRAGGGDHQARQPVRDRGRRPTSPRRTAGPTPATRSRPSAG